MEVTFPDTERWKAGNSGIDYIHTFDSGRAGPHVMVMALTHGNEVSGAIAVDALLKMGLRPMKGRLSLGFANVESYQSFNPRSPDATRFLDEDLNRVWSEEVLGGPRSNREIRRARAMRPFLDTVDFLFDIHSMHEPSAPLMMCGPLDKGIRLAAELGFPEYVVIDAGHANGRRLRDYGDFGRESSAKNAMLIETGQHFSTLSKHVALDAASRFLLHYGVVADGDLKGCLTERKPAHQRFIQITQPVVAQSTDFCFTNPFQGLEVIPKAGTTIAWDAGERVVTPYDDCIIVQPSVRQLGVGVTVARLGKVVPGPVA